MDRECSKTLWFCTPENAEAPYLIVAFFLFSLSPTPTSVSGAGADRSLKLSGRTLIAGASFPRWDKPLMLCSLFPPFGPKTDIVVGRVAGEPEKGSPREPASTGGSAGRKSSGKGLFSYELQGLLPSCGYMDPTQIAYKDFENLPWG